jgi:phosphoribosyl-ATP pyrophosphohydrolase
MSVFATLDQLVLTIAQREGGDAATSYIAKLLNKGATHIAKKVGEEAVEVAIASANGARAEVITESADLLFHLLVLWRAHGITPEDVMAELQRREGTSGIAEKAARTES